MIVTEYKIIDLFLALKVIKNNINKNRVFDIYFKGYMFSRFFEDKPSFMTNREFLNYNKLIAENN